MPKKGYKQSEAHKKKRAEKVKGKANGSWGGGVSRDYAYRVAGTRSNDGKLVHHVNGNPRDNRKENLRLLKGKGPGAKTSSHHEKITDRGQGRPRSDSRSLAYSRAFRLALLSRSRQMGL